jgi:tRNA nucleotidyltransferase (CCA-adding enzyme)
MPDYMFLLESRLSPEQRAVMERVQELARAQEMNVYLTGGAVRDLISGMPIRDLDFTVEGNPAKMARELEKGGAKIVWESEKLRHHELIFLGEVEGSVAAAREDHYERPGTKPDYRFAGVSEDLRRRDFGINAIAISLNVQSRGLLLDPMNGLADLEKQEVRALSIHAFTNQPVRLMRALRYSARMGFNMDSRTKEWFDLAVERKLNENIASADVGHELRALSREDMPVSTLKQWESHGMLELIHEALQKRKPDYESLNKLAKVRGNLLMAGMRPRLYLATLYYTLGKLKDREVTSALKNLEFRSAEIAELGELVEKAQQEVKNLKGKKTATPKDAHNYIASMPAEMMAFIEVEMPNPAVMGKFRNYLQKWRPMYLSLPTAELEALGVPRGPKFDKVMEQFFEASLRGKGKTPEDRTKILKNLAGIKDEPKKLEKEKKKKPTDKTAAAAAITTGAVVKGKAAAAAAADKAAAAAPVAAKPAAKEAPAKKPAPGAKAKKKK